MATKRVLKVTELIDYRKQEASKMGTKYIPITPQERRSCSQGNIFLVVDDLGIESIEYGDTNIVNSAENVTFTTIDQTKFVVLRFMAVMLKFFAILMFLSFIIMSLSQGLHISSFILMFTGAIYGIIIYALGGLISLFLDIEENQRFQKKESQQQHKELMAKLSEKNPENQPPV